MSPHALSGFQSLCISIKLIQFLAAIMLPVIILMALCTVVLAEHVIGVPPEKQALYTTDSHGKWHCLSDPTIELSVEQINDDFCDCPDGSDEPGTNACAFTKESPKYFYCANKGYKEAYIENYKLNDGVCDYDVCCDGSDEYKSGNCPDVCDQVKRQYDAFLAARTSDVENALKVKKDLVSKAQQLKEQLVKNAESIAKEIETDEAHLRSLKSQSEEENGDSGAEESSSSSIIDTFISDHSRKVEETVSQWQTHVESTKERIKTLESMLQNLLENYNPNFNDQAVKHVVSSFADYISNKPEAETEPVWEMPQINLDQISEKLQNVMKIPDNVLPNSDTSLLGKALKTTRSLLGKPGSDSQSKNGEIAKKGDTKKGDSEKIKQLVAEIDDIEKSISQKKSEQAIYTDGINANHGKEDIYRAVKGSWVNKKIGEYNYKLGFLDALYQDTTLVGRFMGVQDNSMFFGHGSKCWNGPQRSARVDMVCGEKHDLISVSEPEKCQYRFLMYSPLACEAMSEEQIARDFKLDRARLKI
ncbi:hypothetical protein OXX80_012093 [Metschnikowia pulcherrima]